MAMIPRTGPDMNLGGAIARPAPDVQIQPTNGFAKQLASAGQLVGDTLSNVENERARRAALDQEAQRKARDASVRAASVSALASAHNQLDDLHDNITQGIVDGSVPKQDAASTYAEQSRKVVEGVPNTLPADQRNLIQAELGARVNQLGSSIGKAVVQRDRMDTTSSIGQALEALQRQYTSDPEGATKQAMDTVDLLGPDSTLTPDQQAKTKQAWKEHTQFTAGYSLVTAGRNSYGGLDKAEGVITDKLPDLDPQKRAELLNQIEVSRSRLDQKREMDAARAQREWERRMKNAESAYGVMQGMADKGTVLDQTYVDGVIAMTSGTPYQAGVVQLAKQAKDGAGFAAMPLAQQQHALDAVNTEIAQQGRTPELDARKNQLEKVYNGSLADFKRDPLRAGLERGVITDIPPLDFGGGLPGVVSQIQARLPGAQRVSMWAGQPVSPLTSDEADHLGQALSNLAPKDRATMVATIATSIGPQASQGLADQIDPKDKALGLAFGYAGTQTPGTPPGFFSSAKPGDGRFVSELILQGQKAKADGTSTKGEKVPGVKASQWQAKITTELGEAFPAQGQSTKIRDAAVLIAHAYAAEQSGDLSDDDLQRAVRTAAGGSVIDFNDRKVPLPAGMDESMLTRRLKGVSPQELHAQAPGGQVLVGGAPMPLADFTESLPGQQLMYAGPGRYAVIVKGRPVLNVNGQPILIGVQ
jgi:hypothetical protein